MFWQFFPFLLSKTVAVPAEERPKKFTNERTGSANRKEHTNKPYSHLLN